MDHEPRPSLSRNLATLPFAQAGEPMMTRDRKAEIFCFSLLVVAAGMSAILLKGADVTANGAAQLPAINVWYGSRQRFGQLGIPQRWVNVLGSVSNPEAVAKLTYSLNAGPEQELSMGKDLFRLAEAGDFNIEIDYRDLRAGRNRVRITALDTLGRRSAKLVTLDFSPHHRWPLPYSIDWSKVAAIPDAVQVVDGRWSLGPDGVRTLAPYYDRVLAIGDLSWTDYEVTVKVTFHAFTAPVKQGPNYGVTHAGIGLRWRGHDTDGQQPRRKWYPLGAATEFTLFPGLFDCRWRILGDNQQQAYAGRAHNLSLEKPYYLKSEVRTLADGLTQYRAKIWPAEDPEVAEWDLVATEGPEDVQSGSALLVAHNSDVTFGNVTIKAVESHPIESSKADSMISNTPRRVR
jgi:hypothetical protein